MLYLAEVRKGREKGRFLGGNRAEFKLLACQRSEQSWSIVPDETILAPEDAGYGDGALVLLELTANKQIQRHSEAGRQIANILQTFSRLQERAKTQEEEIEQWKQSLTYQSQELNRREMEMESRQEQLQEMEADFERLEQQRQEIEAKQQELDGLRAEYDRKSQDLEGAWAQLRGEMSRLEEQQAEFSQAAVLDDAKSQELQDLLNQLSGAVAPTEAVREQLGYAFELLSQQQERVQQQAQTLDGRRAEAQQQQTAVDQQTQELQAHWQQWQQTQAGLTQAQAELAAQERSLALKQEHIQVLTQQLQSQDELHQQFCQLVDATDRFVISAKVDVEALEKMEMSQLEQVVRDLTNDLEKMSRFVSSQEEELALEQEAINELQQQIQAASEYDRLQLETDLTDAQDRCTMLDETLVGQRRTLRERMTVLRQHEAILDKRRGNTSGAGQDAQVDISPVLGRLDTLRQQLTETLQAAQAQAQALQASIAQQQEGVSQQLQSQSNEWQRLQQQEQTLLEQKAAAGERWGGVNAYQETLELAQSGLNGVHEKLEAIAQLMAQFQEASDYQLQAIAAMRQTITSLSDNRTPEFAAS